jgi:hypothetical protein
MDLFVEERGMWFGGVVGHSIRSDRSAVSSRLPGAEECGVTDVADGGDESATSATSLSAAAVRNGLVCYDMHTNTSTQVQAYEYEYGCGYEYATQPRESVFPTQADAHPPTPHNCVEPPTSSTTARLV